MIVFAILGLLIGLLFMFVRQKLSALESRVNLLTDTVQTMAGFRRVEDDDEDEDDDDDDDDEDEEEEEKGPGYFTRVGIENGISFDTIGRMDKEDMKVVSDDEVDEVDMVDVIELKELKELNEVNEVEVKKINLEGPDYESLTLKELKDKVTELGGPKLRTKKELLDFLKK